MPKCKAWDNDKAQHTQAYVSILRRAQRRNLSAFGGLGVKWAFETTYDHFSVLNLGSLRKKFSLSKSGKKDCVLA